MSVFAKHHEVHTCPFCGNRLRKEEEYWPLYETEWPYYLTRTQQWDVKPGYDGVYHKDCWKPWRVAQRLAHADGA